MKCNIANKTKTLLRFIKKWWSNRQQRKRVLYAFSLIGTDDCKADAIMEEIKEEHKKEKANEQ